MLADIGKIKFQTKKIYKTKNFRRKKVDLMQPSMTPEAIVYLMKNLCLHNVSKLSIHSNFHQN